MKKLLIALALAGAATLSAKSFEGTAQFQTFGKDGKKGPVMEMSMKGGKVRIETESRGHKSIVIMDQKAKSMLMLMPEKKLYMVHSINVDPKPSKGGKMTLKKSGRSETIAGYKAEEWLMSNGDSKVSVWGNSELGSYMAGDASRGGVEIPAELREKGLFPLRVSNGEDGKSGGMEAIKVTPGSLDSSLFEAPSGYSEMKGMGAMGGGMEGGAGAGLSPEASERMKKAMENMSPAQRAMMEKLMKKHASAE